MREDYDGYWNDTIEVQCPYCGERVEISVEPDVYGAMVQDCEVCCNPWQLTITRDRDGDVDVRVERAG
jgi:prolyl-tRNA synthetase